MENPGKMDDLGMLKKNGNLPNDWKLNWNLGFSEEPLGTSTGVSFLLCPWCFIDVLKMWCAVCSFLVVRIPMDSDRNILLKVGSDLDFYLRVHFFWHHNFEPEQSLSNLYSARIFHYKPSGYWGSPIYGNPVRFVAWIPLGNGHLPNWEMIYPMKTTNLQ